MAQHWLVLLVRAVHLHVPPAVAANVAATVAAAAIAAEAALAAALPALATIRAAHATRLPPDS